ncbi:MAG: shikimate dehydrogenase [Alphaproteobacteria bacterium]
MSGEGGQKRAAVIGWPIDHSLSPVIHHWWLAAEGLTGTYERIAVPPADLAAFLDRLRGEPGWAGVNVTIPHKETVARLVDEVSDGARATGSVNTVVVQDGRLTGHSTDGPGFMAGLDEQAPGYSPDAGGVCLVGAGGAARAVAAAVLIGGASQLMIVNRTHQRALALRDALLAWLPERQRQEPGGDDRILVSRWEDRGRALTEARLLVNATSLGMTGQPALHLPLGRLPPEAVVCDLVYRPLDTELLRQARARGNRTVDGLGMLLHQAAPAFEMFFGRPVRVTTALRDHVLAAAAVAAGES